MVDTTPRVSVCILSYNRKDKLFHGLLRMTSALDYPQEKLEILVVDNGSSDGTGEMLNFFGARVRVIQNQGNLGIGAWNQAAEAATGEMLLMVDDDAYVDGDVLKRSVRLMQSDPSIGVVSLRPRNPETGLDFHEAYPTGTMSFWGCCALLRKKAVTEAGGLYEPSYFFQAFELDLSMRMRALGWRIVFPGDLPGHHLTSTDGPQSPMKFYFSRRNLLIIAMRYFRGLTRLILLWRLSRLTLVYGKGFPWTVKGKAILLGILRGWQKKSRPLSPEIQTEYFRHFSEFQPGSLQLRMWADRSWWLERPQYYPAFKYQPEAEGNSLLVFTHRFNTDGATLVVLHALRDAEFRSRFSRITIVSNYEGREQENFEALGCRTLVFPFELLGTGRAAHLDSAMEFELAFLLRNAGSVWVNTIDHPARLFELIAESRVRGFVFGHESLADDSPVLTHVQFDDRKRAALARLCSSSHFEVCWPSSSTVEHTRRRLGRKNILRLPYGITTTPRAQTARYEQMDEVRFLVTGWFCERKNQSSLLPVFRRLAELTLDNRAYKPWKLTFVGTPFSVPEYSRFRQQCLEEIPVERLAFRPMIPNADMHALMADSHFVVIPSLGEALCVSAMEMMSAGGLVISSDVEGQEDLIQHGRNGFVFKRNDFAALMAVLLDTVSSDAESRLGLAEMGRAAHQAMSDFSMRRFRENALRLLLLELHREGESTELAPVQAARA